jgi:hypothetical protein
MDRAAADRGEPAKEVKTESAKPDEIKAWLEANGLDQVGGLLGKLKELGDEAGAATQGGQGGLPAHLAGRFRSIPTHFHLNLHAT